MAEAEEPRKTIPNIPFPDVDAKLSQDKPAWKLLGSEEQHVLLATLLARANMLMTVVRGWAISTALTGRA